MQQLKKQAVLGLTSTTRYLGPQIDYHSSINNEIIDLNNYVSNKKEFNNLLNLQFKELNDEKKISKGIKKIGNIKDSIFTFLYTSLTPISQHIFVTNVMIVFTFKFQK